MATTDSAPCDGNPPVEPTSSTHLTRRTVLAAGGVAALTFVPGKTALAAAGGRRSPLPDDVFSLGVASGDPLPNRVVIWTRLAPDPLRLDGTGGMPTDTVVVHWEVAEDPRFARVVRSGAAPARAADGHSVHVDVAGLRPGREYHYRFRAGSQISPAGRTRTAPNERSMPAGARLAVACCQRFTDGYYTAHQGILSDDPDVVFQVGDYFYEKDNGPGPVGRQHLPIGECLTLADYRVRIAQVRSDPDMQAIHAAAPFIVAFDDHEVSGNWASDFPETGQYADATLEEWLARRAAAFQSYWENMPLRAAQRPHGSDIQLYRRLRWGRLATFNVLDTRQYRSDQVADADSPEAADPNRTMLGTRQQDWLLHHLRHPRSRWDVLAQQVPFFAHPDIAHPEDKWDGYRVARNNLIRAMAANRNCHPVVLSGDIHKNRAADLKQDFGDPASDTLGVELTTTSITSSRHMGTDEAVTVAFDPVQEAPHLRFEGTGRGYVLVELTPGGLRADFRVVDSIISPTSPAWTAASFTADPYQPGLHHA